VLSGRLTHDTIYEPNFTRNPPSSVSATGEEATS